MRESIQRLFRPIDDGDDRGASLVEYALLVALIAIVCIVAVAFFGGATGDTFSRVGSSVNAVPPT